MSDHPQIPEDYEPPTWAREYVEHTLAGYFISVNSARLPGKATAGVWISAELARRRREIHEQALNPKPRTHPCGCTMASDVEGKSTCAHGTFITEPWRDTASWIPDVLGPAPETGIVVEAGQAHVEYACGCRRVMGGDLDGTWSSLCNGHIGLLRVVRQPSTPDPLLSMREDWAQGVIPVHDTSSVWGPPRPETRSEAVSGPEGPSPAPGDQEPPNVAPGAPGEASEADSATCEYRWPANDIHDPVLHRCTRRGLDHALHRCACGATHVDDRPGEEHQFMCDYCWPMNALGSTPVHERDPDIVHDPEMHRCVRAGRTHKAHECACGAQTSARLKARRLETVEHQATVVDSLPEPGPVTLSGEEVQALHAFVIRLETEAATLRTFLDALYPRLEPKPDPAGS